MCIKYGEPVKDSEKITLDQVQLKCYETVSHLGNFFNTDNNCLNDLYYIKINNIIIPYPGNT